MKKIWFTLIFLSVLLFSMGVNAATFDLNFDGIMNNNLEEPFIGMGNFSFVGAVSDGTYNLQTLIDRGPYSFSFDFGNGILFDESNINTFKNQVDVIVFDAGDQILFAGSSSTFGGSIEFVNTAGYVLSFSPASTSSDPQNYIVAYQGSVYESGDYGSSNAVPVPAAIWLLGSGIAGLALVRRKTKALSL